MDLVPRYEGHKIGKNAVWICDCCDQPAAFKGQARDKLWKLCVEHGPRAHRDHVVNALEELSAYTKYKAELRKSQKAPPVEEASLW